MRRSLILGPVVAAALTVAGLSGVAQAGSDAGADAAPEPAATPTTVPGGMSLDQVLSMLTPEQIECLVTSMGGTDPNALDLNATMALLQQCGISLDQLMPGGGVTPAVPGVPGGVPSTAPGVPGTPAVPGALDPATVSAILAMLGLDVNSLACITAGVSGGVVTDDVGALPILQNCGLTLVGLLNGLAAVGSMATPGVTAPPLPPPLPGSTVPGVTAPGVTYDMMTQLFIDTFASMGMTLTPEQATCLAGQATSGIDTSDQAQILALLQSCNIDISQLLGG